MMANGYLAKFSIFHPHLAAYQIVLDLFKDLQYNQHMVERWRTDIWPNPPFFIHIWPFIAREG